MVYKLIVPSYILNKKFSRRFLPFFLDLNQSVSFCARSQEIVPEKITWSKRKQASRHHLDCFVRILPNDFPGRMFTRSLRSFVCWPASAVSRNNLLSCCPLVFCENRYSPISSFCGLRACSSSTLDWDARVHILIDGFITNNDLSRNINTVFGILLNPYMQLYLNFNLSLDYRLIGFVERT